MSEWRTFTNTEDGVGTVSAMATIAAILILTTSFLLGVAVQVEKTRAQTALDLASLNAARAVVEQVSQVDADDPCTVARRVSIQNGLTVSQCNRIGLDIYLAGEKPISILNFTFALIIRSHSGYIKEFLIK